MNFKILSTIASRAGLANQLGQSFDGKRDLYNSCGYPKNLTYDQYRDVFDRGDLGKTIVSAYPVATWVRNPIIRENEKVENDSTAFEQDWKNLLQNVPVFSYLQRADVLCGIGSFGVLFLGFDDGLDFAQPCTRARNLLYMKPLAEGSVNIVSYDEDTSSPRYGLPVLYDLTFGQLPKNTQISGSNVVSSVQKRVHWTRVLHLADNQDESDVFGVPRLQPLYNRLFDCQKILGCSAEMFWQGAFQGLSFEADSESELINKAALEEEIQKYVHGLQRYMQLQGIKTNVLHSTVAPPGDHIKIQLQFISAATRIPLRVLTGSERGELSSVQDENNWKDRIEERRNRFATDNVIKPFVKRLVDVGVLTTPKNGEYSYFIEWNDVSSTTQKQQMEIARMVTDAIRMYVESRSFLLIPPEQYLEKVMKFPPEVIKQFSEGGFNTDQLLDEMKKVPAQGPSGTVPPADEKAQVKPVEGKQRIV